MPGYSFEGKVPQIDEKAYVHPDAVVIGDVIIGAECFVGAGAIIRGDYGSIRIGPRSAVEEGCVIHAPPDETCEIGSDVTLGHGAIIHCAKIGDFAEIDIGAILGFHAIIEEYAVIGAGAVVPQERTIPRGKVAVGNPAKVIKDSPEENKDIYRWIKAVYVELCSRYKKGVEKLW